MKRSIRFRRCTRTLCVLVASAAFISPSAHADEPIGADQAAPWIPVGIQSGAVENAGSFPQVIFSDVIEHTGAAWMRLVFGDVDLAGNEADGNASFLRITSLYDGGTQIMKQPHLAQWQYHSAFFNGDSVLVELVAHGGTGTNAIEVLGVIAGEFTDGDGPMPRSLCDGADDRQLSADPRSARAVNASGTQVGTVFLIDDANRTFLTSHPTGGLLSGAAVIEFNPPLTFPDGTTLNHPPPEDQYVYDPASIQRMTGTGNNWCYFGCFANSTTGQTPFERQQAFFALADEIPEPGEQDVRVYSFGQTEPPVFRTWSYVQKTVLGELTGMVGTRIQFRADTSLGDSGAPVLNELTSEVLGIAYEDGCTAVAGANGATAVTNANLRTALSSPLGVCRSIVFSIQGGTPELIDNVSETILVDAAGVNGNGPVPGTGQLHYNTGDGWLTLEMEDVAPGVFSATFPPFPCGTLIDYFFSAETLTGVRFPDPDYPPQLHRSIAATSQSIIANLNFETAVGWTVDGTVTDGEWTLGVPVADTIGAPLTDFDGSGQCWLTDNVAGESDVDGGPTRLRSPNFNLSASTNAFVWFGWWLTNNNNDGDALTLQISNNGGLSYVTAKSYTHATGWQEGRFRVDQFVAPTAGVRFRFNVADNPNNSVTEGAVDAFRIIDYQCDSVSCDKGDVNQDGLVDGRDIDLFTQTLLDAGSPGSVEFCATDIDNDNVLEVEDDAGAFVTCLLNGACP